MSSSDTTNAVVDFCDKKNDSAVPTVSLLQRYKTVRKQTLSLIKSLSAEDAVAQSMPDASPAKWHLAHTTWFFETFILKPFFEGYIEYDSQFNYLFNSYYESVGSRHARPQRGLLTRPTLQSVMAYRHAVDQAIMDLMQCELSSDAHQKITFLLTVGMHHEMQHQELISTDILHLFWHNPTFPCVHDLSSRHELPSHKRPKSNVNHSDAKPSVASLKYIPFEGGMVTVGHDAASAQTANDFAYDCECPSHEMYLQPFALSNRLITNGEWLEFITDGGYQNSLLWLSDGWHCAQKNQWSAPLYWLQEEGVGKGAQAQFGLDGLQAIDWHAPVSHISFYEADAFARWAGKRLPLEHEWEHVAHQQATKTNVLEQANFLEKGVFRPQVAQVAQVAKVERCLGRQLSNDQSLGNALQVHQLYGDVWEWTQSAFSPYPRFQAEQGALGEYNGKFMANQYVLRGGSCVTPKEQVRSTYRNFFYPHHRWQFSGLRLAEYQ